MDKALDFELLSRALEESSRDCRFESGQRCFIFAVGQLLDSQGMRGSIIWAVRRSIISATRSARQPRWSPTIRPTMHAETAAIVVRVKAVFNDWKHKVCKPP